MARCLFDGLFTIPRMLFFIECTGAVIRQMISILEADERHFNILVRRFGQLEFLDELQYVIIDILGVACIQDDGAAFRNIFQRFLMLALLRKDTSCASSRHTTSPDSYTVRL